MGELVDQGNCWVPDLQRIDVELLKSRPAVGDVTPWDALKRIEHRFGAHTSVGLCEPHHDVGSCVGEPTALGKHCIGLASSGSNTKENV